MGGAGAPPICTSVAFERPRFLCGLFRHVRELAVDQTDRGRGFDPREDRACALELGPCAAQIPEGP